MPRKPPGMDKVQLRPNTSTPQYPNTLLPRERLVHVEQDVRGQRVRGEHRRIQFGIARRVSLAEKRIRGLRVLLEPAQAARQAVQQDALFPDGRIPARREAERVGDPLV